MSAPTRFLTSRRGLVAVAISLATLYTLTLYDAGAAVSAAAANGPASSSSGTGSGRIYGKWTWETALGDNNAKRGGAGLNRGDTPRNAAAAQQRPVEPGVVPHQRYRADEDPILALAGVKASAGEEKDTTPPPANHRARPFGRVEEVLKPADRDAIEKAKGKARVYAPHEAAKLEAERVVQAPQADDAAGAAKKKAGSRPDSEKAAAGKEDLAKEATSEAAKDGGAGTVDEESGSASSAPGEDALEDAPSFATEKGAAEAAPMAALVLPVDKRKETLAIPPDSSDKKDSPEPASHAAVKGASPDTNKEPELAPPPSEKIREPAGGRVADAKKGKDLAAETDATKEADPVKPAAGNKPKIGTGGRVVKPVAADVVPKPAAPQREKAGKVVKQEAGRRVGTGARPGAKGMGNRMRRRRLVRR